MFFRKRHQPEPDPASFGMKWIIIAFVLYGFFTIQRPDTKEEPNPVRKAVNQAADELKPSNFVNFSEYKEKLFPGYVGALRIKDTKLGSGLPVVCGQEATITYDTFLPNNKPFDDSATAEKPLSFVIGEHKVMPIFEQGVIGMQPDGMRSLLAPPNLAYGREGFVREDTPKNELMRFEVTLLGAKPALPDPDKSLYRIAQVRQGVGTVILCGERIKLHVTVWGVDGKKLFSTQDNNAEPLQFTLGASEVIVGLEQGVIGMTMGEQRTLIIPPEFQKPLRKEKPDVEIPLPASQTVLVDVETVQ